MTKTTKSIVFAVTLLGSAVVALAILLLVADHARAAIPLKSTENTHSLDLVGQIGGKFKALAVQDKYLYAAIGPRMTVLDVADAAHPILKGQTGVLPIDIQALAVQGTTVYAAAGADGLAVFDVSNLSQPVETVGLKFPGNATGVAITGTHVFVSTSIDLQIVDVSQPGGPQAVGSYPGNVSDIAFTSNTMYLALGNKMSILDISNPASPSLIVDENVPAYEIEIDGNLVFIGNTGKVMGPAGWISYGILRILDVSGLPVITEVFFSGDEYPGVQSQLVDMKLLDHKLFGYSFACGNHISDPCYLSFGGVDVSDPASPSLASTFFYSDYSSNWSHRGSFAVGVQTLYTATLDLLHIFNTDTFAEQGQYASWKASQVFVANQVAYVAAGTTGLLAIDVSTANRPNLMNTFNASVDMGGYWRAWITNMAIYGPYIYAELQAGSVFKLYVLDISNKTDIKGTPISNLYVAPIRIHNGYGYYFYYSNGVQLKGIDLSNPTQPTFTSGSIATTNNEPHLSLIGGNAYVVGESVGLDIINVANPQNFVEAKKLTGPIPAFLIESANHSLYIFTDQALKIYDVSDPVNPVETSSTPLTGLNNLAGMKVSNDEVYLIQNNYTNIPYNSTVRVFHSNDLSSPVSEGTGYTRPGSSFTSIDVVGDWVYVSSWGDGLFIFHHTVSNPSLSEHVYLPSIRIPTQALPGQCAITYRTNMQNLGWLEWLSDGNVSGEAGAGLRVEALQVQLCAGLPDKLGVIYQAHVQDIGWMDWVYDNQIAGTTGEAKRLEAVRFKLLNAPDNFHITYRVYVEGIGWTASVSDGEIAGTTGQSKRVEAIQINLVRP